MAKSNYQHEKRQKDLAKKKKREEKRLRKAEKSGTGPEGGLEQPSEDRPAPPAE